MNVAGAAIWRITALGGALNKASWAVVNALFKFLIQVCVRRSLVKKSTIGHLSKLDIWLMQRFRTKLSKSSSTAPSWSFQPGETKDRSNAPETEGRSFRDWFL